MTRGTIRTATLATLVVAGLAVAGLAVAGPAPAAPPAASGTAASGGIAGLVTGAPAVHTRIPPRQGKAPGARLTERALLPPGPMTSCSTWSPPSGLNLPSTASGPGAIP
jgi:hypothetical protein